MTTARAVVVSAIVVAFAIFPCAIVAAAIAVAQNRLGHAAGKLLPEDRPKTPYRYKQAAARKEAPPKFVRLSGARPRSGRGPYTPVTGSYTLL